MRKRIDRYCGKDFTPLWMYDSIEDVTLGKINFIHLRPKLSSLFLIKKLVKVEGQTEPNTELEPGCT